LPPRRPSPRSPRSRALVRHRSNVCVASCCKRRVSSTDSTNWFLPVRALRRARVSCIRPARTLLGTACFPAASASCSSLVDSFQVASAREVHVARRAAACLHANGHYKQSERLCLAFLTLTRWPVGGFVAFVCVCCCFRVAGASFFLAGMDVAMAAAFSGSSSSLSVSSCGSPSFVFLRLLHRCQLRLRLALPVSSSLTMCAPVFPPRRCPSL